MSATPPGLTSTALGPSLDRKTTGLPLRRLLRHAYDELVGMSEVVTSSGLDWTIVRFLAPKDGPAKGRVREGFYGQDKLGFNVTRADVAALTAAQFDDDRYIGAAPAINTDQEDAESPTARLPVPDHSAPHQRTDRRAET